MSDHLKDAAERIQDQNMGQPEGIVASAYLCERMRKEELEASKRAVLDGIQAHMPEGYDGDVAEECLVVQFVGELKRHRDAAFALLRVLALDWPHGADDGPALIVDATTATDSELDWIARRDALLKDADDA